MRGITLVGDGANPANTCEVNLMPTVSQGCAGGDDAAQCEAWAKFLAFQRQPGSAKTTPNNLGVSPAVIREEESVPIAEKNTSRVDGGNQSKGNSPEHCNDVLCANSNCSRPRKTFARKNYVLEQYCAIVMKLQRKQSCLCNGHAAKSPDQLIGLGRNWSEHQHRPKSEYCVERPLCGATDCPLLRPLWRNTAELTFEGMRYGMLENQCV